MGKDSSRTQNVLKKEEIRQVKTKREERIIEKKSRRKEVLKTWDTRNHSRKRFDRRRRKNE